MTLKEIAERAGVSTATVSYVLNGSPKIGDETRCKVEKIIKEEGYHSNFLAQGLRTNRTYLVGVIVEDITVRHMPYIIDGINEAADKTNYKILLSNLRLLSKIESQFEHISKFQKDIDKAVEPLMSMQVDGIIYVGMHDRMIRDVLHDIDKPVVYCYCYTYGEGTSVGYSNEKAAFELTNEFIRKGHRRFGIIKGAETSEPCHLRMKGIQTALDEAGIHMDPAAVKTGDWKYDTARKAATELLQQKDNLDAIIAMNDDMAAGCMDAARALGISIPQDLSLSGFDNSSIIQYVTPRITTVERPLHEMGVRAMEILIDKMENKTNEDINITLPCRIIQGDSIREMKD